MSGSAPRSSSVAPEKSLENVVSSARNGRWTRNDSIDASIVGGLLEIVWRSASGSRPTASHVSAIVVNRCALVFEIGSTMRAASPSSLKKRGSSVPGSARLRGDRLEVLEQARRLLDRAPDGGAAAGERVAEAAQVLLAGRARLGVEDLEDLVEVDVVVGLLERDRVAVLVGRLRVALLELEVLEAERRARADAPARVLGDLADRLVELELELGAGLAGAELDRLHVLHHADAEAAGADLVALDQVLPVGEAHLQRRRRDERQALVGVVGQEDRDDHDQHGHRAHEHGVGEHGGCGAASHGLRR